MLDHRITKIILLVLTVVTVGKLTITGIKLVLDNIDVSDRTTPDLSAIADLSEPNTYFCWRYWGGCR